MPSLLSDENAPVRKTAAASPPPPLDHPSSHLGAKANGQDPPLRPRSPDDSPDDRSSVRSDSTAQMNGDSSAATTMSTTLTNGNGNGIPDGHGEGEQPAAVVIPRKPLANGDANGDVNGDAVPATAFDRTAPLQLQPLSPVTNGTRDGDSTSTSPKDAQPRTSGASTRASSVQASPVEMYIRQVNKGDVVTVETGAANPSRAPSSATAAATTATAASSPDLSAPRSQSHLPHRFSSPPQYQPGAASPAGGLHPPSASPAGLKHRHTLEVPRLAPPRPSRDGIDTAIASGRFSPTTATTPGGGIGGASGAGVGVGVGTRRASLSLARRNTRSLHSELPRDEVVPDEDALRWAEAYRQKRASKRRRMEQEDDDRVLVGTKVDESHANWVTAYNMLTGIRVSVSRTNAKLDRPLTDADFEAKQKSTFDIAGNEMVPSAKYDFKFKDYAPWVFRHLRALFRLDPADYLVSLTGKYILSELGSPGKSGSFFYFSRDYKYIIKTIHHSEHKFLRKILKDYFEHVTENPNTLLSQFYGLHRVKMPYGKKIHFVVMNNLFPPHRDVHNTFDLKGSTFGRDYKEEDLAKNPRATLKDLNWLRRHEHLELGLEKKRLFLEQLNKDVRLLQKLQIMDYSLLIGIHDLRKGNEENLRGKTLQVFSPGGDTPQEEFDPHSVLMRTPSKLENQRKARELRQMIKAERPVPISEGSNGMPDELGEGHSKDSIFHKDDGGFRATHENNAPGEEIYYLGIIDCLTHYGVIKKIENFWKGLSHDKNQISAQPPEQYGERFLNFMSGITMSAEETAREAHEKEQAAVAAAAAAAVAAAAAAEAAAAAVAVAAVSAEQQQEAGKGKERVGGWNGSLRRKVTAAQIPPAPSYQPPPPPSSHPGHLSPEAEAVMRRAEQEARKSPYDEEKIPDMTLMTTTSAAGTIIPSAAVAAASPSTANGIKHALPQIMAHVDRRESASQVALPVVEEAGEGSSTEGRSRNSRFSGRTVESDGRPLTPAKDGKEREAGFGNPILSHGSRSGGSANPLTPPKSGYLKPESADSGYGVSGGVTRSRSGTAGTTGSGSKVKVQLSRESLDKALPPLPKLD